MVGHHGRMRFFKSNFAAGIKNITGRYYPIFDVSREDRLRKINFDLKSRFFDANDFQNNLISDRLASSISQIERE